MQIPEQCHWPCSSVSIVNFEHVITDWEHYSIFWLLLLPSLVKLEQCKSFLCHSQCFCFCQCFFLRDVFKHIYPMIFHHTDCKLHLIIFWLQASQNQLFPNNKGYNCILNFRISLNSVCKLECIRQIFIPISTTIIPV